MTLCKLENLPREEMPKAKDCHADGFLEAGLDAWLSMKQIHRQHPFNARLMAGETEFKGEVDVEIKRHPLRLQITFKPWTCHVVGEEDRSDRIGNSPAMPAPAITAKLLEAGGMEALPGYVLEAARKVAQVPEGWALDVKRIDDHTIQVGGIPPAVETVEEVEDDAESTPVYLRGLEPNPLRHLRQLITEGDVLIGPCGIMAIALGVLEVSRRLQEHERKHHGGE